MNNKRYTIYGNSNDLDGIQEAVDLVKENEKLNNIINKAIEYILTINDEYIQYSIGWVKNDLLDILKGVELTENDKK